MSQGAPPISSSPAAGSLRDVARRANVSVSTASRVLNGEIKGAYTKVAKRNARLLKIAEELNYRPSFRARSLAEGKTMNVALLYARPAAMVGGRYGLMVNAAVEALQEQGYHLTLWGLSPEDAARTDLFLDRRFDGIIVHHAVSQTLRLALDRVWLPAVLLNGIDPAMTCIVPDDQAAARLLTDRLIAAGHRSIRIVCPRGGHFSADVREAGYRDAMAAAGLPADMVPIEYTDKFSERWLDGCSSPGGPTALIFYHAAHAIHAVGAASRLGLHVPDDISIATFGPYEAIEFCQPELTRTEVPFAEMGRQAADLLLHLMRGSDALTEAPASGAIPHTFVAGASIAPPSRPTRFISSPRSSP